MNNRKNYTRKKPLVLIALSATMLATLTSCKTNNLEVGDSVYAKNGDYQVTEKEMWDALKWDASFYMEEQKEELILQPYLEELDSVLKGSNEELKEYYYEFLEYHARLKIYNLLTDEKVLELTSKEKALAEEKYIDSYYVKYNEVIDRDFLFESKTVNGTEFKYVNIYHTVYLEVAKQMFGIEKLKEEIKETEEETKKPYYKDEKIIEYFEDNLEYETQGKAVVIRFTHDDEMNTTLKAFGLKLINDQFYYLPQTSGMTEGEYSKYYDDFDYALPSNYEKLINIASVGGDAAIFQLYVEIYNYIYTYRTPLTSIVQNPSLTDNKRNHTDEIISYYMTNEIKDPKEIVSSWDQNITDIISYDKETYENVGMFNKYIYTFLSDDSNSKDGRYATHSNPFDGFAYLAFKVEQDPLENELCDPKDKDLIVNEDLKATIIEELIEDEANSAYYVSKLKEEKEELSVKIYDEAIEISYAKDHEEYSKTHKKAPTNDTLYTLSYDGRTLNVKYEETYEQLLVDFGPTEALELLSKKVIKDTTIYSEITDKQIEGYEDDLDNLLSAFAANQLAAQGYPSSLGKYNFLMLYYGTTNIDEIIENSFKVSYTISKVLSEYTNDDDLFDLFQQYSQIAYNNGFKVSGSNILVYVDMDEDGIPDQDFDWNTVAKNNLTYTENVDLLLEDIFDIIHNTTPGVGSATALSGIVEEYSVASRFTNYVGDPITGTAINQWSEFKKLGIYVKLQEFTDVVNTTSENDQEETYVSNELKQRVAYLYENSNLIIGEQTQSLYLDEEKYSSNDGWNFMLITKATIQTSAKFEKEDDLNGLYEDIIIKYNDEYLTVENLYNSNDIISKNQIELFVYEYVASQSTNLFPEDLIPALTAYFQPVYTRYNGNNTQSMFLLQIVDDLEFTNADEMVRLHKGLSIAQKQEDKYLEDSDISFNFAGWWDAISNLGGSK